MDLLILCCFGGVPFIQFPSSSHTAGGRPIRHQWDPTDWVAIDLSGSLLNASSNAAGSLVATNPALRSLVPPDLPPQLSLDQCDLWNLTFASGADQHMFRASRAKLKCRCLPEFTGSACQQSPSSSSSSSSSSSAVQSPPSSPMASSPSPSPFPPSLPPSALALEAMPSANDNNFGLFLLVFMLLAAGMVALFLMLRGCCFCDCFGGLGRSSGRYEQPLDPHTVNTCMDAIRAHEEEEKSKWAGNGQWTIASPPSAQSANNQQQQALLSSMVVDSRRPLLTSQPTPSSAIPSISGSMPSSAPPRACSPPPSYRSLNSSLEQLPGGGGFISSTKI